MTYDEALRELDALTDHERIHVPEAVRGLRSERMRELCERLGEPQRAFRAIVVGGTNGKGSISAMIYSILRESRLRVGLYASPHIEHVRERIRTWVGGPSQPRAEGDDWISEAAFGEALERVLPVVERWRRGGEAPPTYFEALTAVAFEQFKRQGVEVAVLEVGLGGRLDATNVVEQSVSVLAPIALDHMDILGTDLAAIAREKAGIIKPRQTVITAPQQAEALAAIRDACAEQGSALLQAEADLTSRIHRHDLDGLQLSIAGVRGVYEELELPLLGRHQALNAAVAVGAVEALSSAGMPRAMVERGLAQVACPARIEVVQEEPLVLLDGAHNAHAARALADTLQELGAGRRIHLLVGMSSDKAVEGVGEALGPLAADVTCCQSRHPRALPAETLAKRLAPYCAEVHVMPDPVDAYTYLTNAADRADVVVVTGSFYLVGPLRAALKAASRAASRDTAALT